MVQYKHLPLYSFIYVKKSLFLISLEVWVLQTVWQAWFNSSERVTEFWIFFVYFLFETWFLYVAFSVLEFAL